MLQPVTKKILLVEDTKELWSSIIRGVKTMNLPVEIECVADYFSAIEKYNVLQPDLIICDYKLPNLRNGLEFWNYCKSSDHHAKFLIISAIPSNDFLGLISEYSDHPSFLAKPFSLKDLQRTISAMLDLGEYAINQAA